MLAGVAVAGAAPGQILTAGLVLVFVEAFSMAVGSLLSEQAAEEAARGKEAPLARAIFGAAVMFISFTIAGFLPLLPYLLLPITVAFPASILFS